MEREGHCERGGRERSWRRNSRRHREGGDRDREREIAGQRVGDREEKKMKRERLCERKKKDRKRRKRKKRRRERGRSNFSLSRDEERRTQERKGETLLSEEERRGEISPSSYARTRACGGERKGARGKRRNGGRGRERDYGKERRRKGRETLWEREKRFIPLAMKRGERWRERKERGKREE